VNHYRKELKKQLAFHKQRIQDIENGEFDHFEKSFCAKLLAKSKHILLHPEEAC